jgi:hypothetical protein
MKNAMILNIIHTMFNLGDTEVSIRMTLKEIELSCVCVLRVSIIPLSTILIFDFEILLTVK